MKRRITCCTNGNGCTNNQNFYSKRSSITAAKVRFFMRRLIETGLKSVITWTIYQYQLALLQPKLATVSCMYLF